MKKAAEFLSILRAKKPVWMVLFAILLFNVVFFVLASLVISALALDGTEKMSFFEAAFCTVTMILDAGCIQFVVADIGTAGVAVVLICLAVVLIGMVTFSGAVIGYITNIISGFIENASDVSHPLRISGHTVILNWNNRASEIINDLLYTGKREIVVVLVRQDKENIEREIEERLAYTARTRHLKNKVTAIVKQGEIFSHAQLKDISIEQAKTVILLGSGRRPDDVIIGDAGIVKMLMQVCVMTASANSADDQKIVVEVEDSRTWELVQGIIRSKQVKGKCDVVPLKINETLGRMLAQFALMPRLNHVYRELFSNRGATFYTAPAVQSDEDTFIRGYLSNHTCALPLTQMESGGSLRSYFIAACEDDIDKLDTVPQSGYSVRLNHDFVLSRQKVVILGYNSKAEYILQGFASFYAEWGPQDPKILSVTLVDSVSRMSGFDKSEFPFVKEAIAADFGDREIICDTLERVLADGKTDTNIIILSDDTMPPAELDANAFASLIYVQEVLDRKRREDSGFNVSAVDVLVEIVDPRHVDIVRNYSVSNVVVSSRYTSKMITQIGEKDAINDIYSDILMYDDPGCEKRGYTSKEIYVKDVSTYFAELPGPCTAAELVRAVYEASADPTLDHLHYCPAVVLGYCTPDGQTILFSGDLSDIPVTLTEKDKIVVFSSH